MSIGAQQLWLIPLLPLLAAAILAVSSRGSRTLASFASIGAMAGSLVLSILAFGKTLGGAREAWNFTWLQTGAHGIYLGFLLDPLTAAMLVMVTFVGLLIFIYSTGYMHDDENYTKFFCFMSLFASGMLGLVVSNSLLLLFVSWEIVGVASFLLIGFWFTKPSAAAAARKAFITTRIGDIGFFLGLLWLYSATGTQLFYDNGNGCLEKETLAKLITLGTPVGIAAVTAIALLIFCGAVGKSGQVPLHVWLPDAMEGPTPVSALIHAATMVAAGVFLVARVYPLMDADASGLAGISPALSVVTWVGAITAVFAALVATAQNDIKRILAYSTVSQLGYMMMGLGVGGVAVGMFHLITHAFFKALLFLGAGSVIHGSHGEQDIRRMGGLRQLMPITFATYAVGMLALAGFPLFFSGFWSKDEILHAAFAWKASKIPFLLGLFGAFLTAFYMTRQVVLVFFGTARDTKHKAHESPGVMTMPLMILAVFAILLGFVGTPFWPWFQTYLTGEHGHFEWSSFLLLAFMSMLVVFAGLGLGWALYRGKSAAERDPLEQKQPVLYPLLANKFYVDELYAMSFGRWLTGLGKAADWSERVALSAGVKGMQLLVLAGAWLSRLFDNFVIDKGFEKTCSELQEAAQSSRRLQDGQVQNYLRTIGVAFAVLAIFLAWGCRQ